MLETRKDRERDWRQARHDKTILYPLPGTPATSSVTTPACWSWAKRKCAIPPSPWPCAVSACANRQASARSGKTSHVGVRADLRSRSLREENLQTRNQRESRRFFLTLSGNLVLGGKRLLWVGPFPLESLLFQPFPFSSNSVRIGQGKGIDRSTLLRLVKSPLICRVLLIDDDYQILI
jgi:hypothetical protein